MANPVRASKVLAGYGAYPWIIASVAAVAGFLFGFDTAVINGALIFLRRQFSLGSMGMEIAASSLLLGCLIGAACAGTMSDRLGRRRSLLAAAILFTLSSGGSASATGFDFFVASRFLGGLAIGLASALTPVYIAEVSPPAIRGRLVSLNQLAIVTGILAAYLANWLMASRGEASWRWMFGVAALPSLGFGLGLLLIPESPRWLVMRGARDEGKAVLERVVGRVAADSEVSTIERALAEESGGARELLAPRMRRRLTIAIALAMLEQFSGINAVLYYGSVLVSEHLRGASAQTALGANILIGVVNLVCTVLAMTWIDRWGRRKLFLLAAAGMSASLLVLALTLRLPSPTPAILLASVLLYVASFATGMGPGVWVYIAEIFPTQVRGLATSVATSALWTACLIVTLTFLSITDRLGVTATFLLYAAISLGTFVFVLRYVPETCGRSLEEIQMLWPVDEEHTQSQR